MTQRVHLFPFRTQKLSSVVPKILAWRRAGKIGKRQHSKPGGDNYIIVSAEVFIPHKDFIGNIRRQFARSANWGIDSVSSLPVTKANRGVFAKQNAVVDRKPELGH